MKKQHSAVFLTALLATVLLSAAPALAQGQSGSTTANVFDGGGTFIHFCGNEFVECEGNTGVMLHTSLDQNGEIHVAINIRDMGISCVGLDSGVTYRSAFVNAVGRNNVFTGFEDCEDTGCTAHLAAIWHLIAQGDAPNMRAKSLATIVFNGQGEPIKVDFAVTELDCGE